MLQPLFLFQLTLGDEQCEVTRNGYESKELVYLVHIYCQVRQDCYIPLHAQHECTKTYSNYMKTFTKSI